MKIFQKVDLQEIYEIDSNLFKIDNIEVGLEIQLKAEDVAYLNSEPEFFAFKNRILDKKKLKVEMVHAPFKDLTISSEDNFIRDYSIRNILGGIDFCFELGVKNLVFHTGFPPCLPASKIPAGYDRLKKSLEPIYTYALKRNITLLVENTYEKNLDLFEKIFADFPRILLTLDLGHLHCFAKDNPEIWIDKFREKIAHFHIHDNDLEEDLHLSLGRGKIPYKGLMKELPAQSSITLETPLSEIRENVFYMKQGLGL